MKLGIIGAMEVEVATLRDQMDVERTVTRANMDFSEGVLNGCPAVVVRCGIGKVNAAACAQILADEFGVTHVVNTGVAGSLDNRIEIGDVVVSTDAVHHDMDVTGLGYAPGEVPQVGTVAFPANDGMRERAVEACHQVVPEIGVFEGRVALELVQPLVAAGGVLVDDDLDLVVGDVDAPVVELDAAHGRLEAAAGVHQQHGNGNDDQDAANDKRRLGREAPRGLAGCVAMRGRGARCGLAGGLPAGIGRAKATRRLAHSRLLLGLHRLVLVLAAKDDMRHKCHKREIRYRGAARMRQVNGLRLGKKPVSGADRTRFCAGWPAQKVAQIPERAATRRSRPLCFWWRGRESNP